MSSSSLELLGDDASQLVSLRHFEVSGWFIFQLSGFDPGQGRFTTQLKALSEWDAAARAMRQVRSSVWGARASDDRRGPPFRFCTWLDVRVTEVVIEPGGKVKKRRGPKKRLKL